MGRMSAPAFCAVGRSMGNGGDDRRTPPGSGADEAWWGEAIHQEYGLAIGSCKIEACADVRNCFGRLVRQLGAALLESRHARVHPARLRLFPRRRVCPQRVGVWGGIPVPATVLIPQGCPFSAMVIALTVRPWLLGLRQAGVRGRALVDDLKFTVEGSSPADCQARFQSALAFTQRYIEAIGGGTWRTTGASRLPTALSSVLWQGTVCGNVPR